MAISRPGEAEAFRFMNTRVPHSLFDSSHTESEASGYECVRALEKNSGVTNHSVHAVALPVRGPGVRRRV